MAYHDFLPADHPAAKEHAAQVAEFEARQKLVNSIKTGDRVTILVPNGIGRDGQEWKEKSGRAVMRGPYGWVLNMGGRYGTPGIASERSIVRVTKRGE